MKKTLKIKSILILVFVVVLSMFKDTFAIAVPKASNDFYVNDFSNVIDQDVENHIINLNDFLFDETGAQIVIVTVDFFDGHDIVDYAYTLFNDWGIGTNDNGFLLILGIGADDYYCLRGPAVDSFISDSRLDILLSQYLEPFFVAERYSEGIEAFFNVIYYMYELNYGISYQQSGMTTVNNTTNSNSSFFDKVIITILTIFIIFILIAIVIRPSRNVVIVDGTPRRRRSFFGPVFYPRSRYTRRRRYHDGGYYHNQYNRRHRSNSTTRAGGVGNSVESPASSRMKPVSKTRTGGGGTTRGGGVGRNTTTTTTAPRSKPMVMPTHKNPTNRVRTGGSGTTRGGGIGRSSSSGGLSRPTTSRTSSANRSSGLPRTGGINRGGGVGRRK